MRLLKNVRVPIYCENQKQIFLSHTFLCLSDIITEEDRIEVNSSSKEAIRKSTIHLANEFEIKSGTLNIRDDNYKADVFSGSLKTLTQP